MHCFSSTAEILKPVWHTYGGWSFWSPFLYGQFLLTTARSFIFRVEADISGTQFKHIKSRFYCQSFQSMSFLLLDSCRPKNMITKLPLPKWTPSFYFPLPSFPSSCRPASRARLQEALNLQTYIHRPHMFKFTPALLVYFHSMVLLYWKSSNLKLNTPSTLLWRSLGFGHTVQFIWQQCSHQIDI